MKRAALIIFLCAGFVNACVHAVPWTGGVPASGANLSNDQRMREYARFIPSRVAVDGVTIHEGAKEVRYTYETYLPVVRALDPSVEARVQSAKTNSRWFVLAAAIGAGFGAYATQDHIDKLHRYGAIGLAGLGYAAQHFFVTRMADDETAALKSLRTRLDQKLFP